MTRSTAFSLAEGLEVLERTPATLRSLLAGLSEHWTEARDDPDSWNAREVLGHLVHGEETDWIPRSRIILEAGEGEPFEPFDREAQFQRFDDWDIERLLNRFDQLRGENLRTLEGWNLQVAQLELRGTHPELGAVSLGELLATWVAHDLSHIVQLCRTMARRYRPLVGPWRRYLSLLAE